ncbi:MAG: CcdB family protein [Burkholderiaceae bacterium]
MARFDVYTNPDSAERDTVPYYLDVQNNFLDTIQTKVVIPLHFAHRLEIRVRNLNPVFEVKGKSVVMNTAAIGAVPAGELRRPVGNLAAQQLEITDALDTLLGGY